MSFSARKLKLFSSTIITEAFKTNIRTGVKLNVYSTDEDKRISNASNDMHGVPDSVLLQPCYSGTRRGGGGVGVGALNKILFGDAPPHPNPYHFIYHFLKKKVPLSYTYYVATFTKLFN